MGYECAGTIEFLMDMETGEFYFIEVNPRVQVEHTVTEEVTGIDIVRAQILIAEGKTLVEATGIAPASTTSSSHGHAIQCRITTEDPTNNFIPDYGRITAYRGATGMGIRLDGGTAYSGAVITRYYDSLLEKVTAWAPTPEAAIARMDRALREFRIRGVATNIAFVENLLKHPTFLSNEYHTKFIDETPELFDFKPRRDRATKILTYIADITVNGHPETEGRPQPAAEARAAACRRRPRADTPAAGTRQILDDDGAAGAWPTGWRRRPQLLITDTTMRDGHQSLLATRMRSIDMIRVAPAYAANLPQLFSRRMLGRRDLRRGLPLPAGMPLAAPARPARGDAEPDDADAAARLERRRLHQLSRQRGAGLRRTRRAETGVDVFRVFDSLNWVENMRVAMDAVIEAEQGLRGHDLLHRRHPRPRPREVRPEVLRRHGARS